MPKTQPHFVRISGRFVSATLTALFAALAIPSESTAGAFALTEHNAVGLGVGYSSAAVAADASTTYFNPAGLTHLDKPELIVVAHLINLDATFTDAGSNTAGVFPIGGGNGGNAGSTEVIPSLYYAHPINSTFSFGLGLSAPWGLQTEYDDGWVGRYHALKTRLESANLNPSFGWRLSDTLSFGGGINIQQVKAEIGNAIDFGLVGFSMGIPGFMPGGADAEVFIKGDSVDYGWNAALLWEPSPGVRFGVSYRSGMTHDIDGDATFSSVPAPFAAVFPNQAASAGLAVPDIWSVHAMHKFNDRWMLTADWSLFGFSSLRSIDIDFSNPATQDSSLVQNWRDAAIYSGGLHYRATDTVTLRAGYVYNESPVTNAALRSPRIPDSNRRWITAGLSWKATAGFTFDAGYARVSFSDAPISMTDDFGHTLLGIADMSADVFSVQGTWSF
jgi:long-chain fatty acid transport protein